MNKNDLRSTLFIALIFGLRMVGLFMLLPILSLYISNLKNSTSLLIGLAMGGYGLTQALLQIPFGVLSDFFGRKKIIALGLLIYIIGSLVCALSHNIYILIFGRVLQGAGAVSGALLALLSDLTSSQDRSKATALVGMSIGASFAIGFIVGPYLNSQFSIDTIFYIAALLGVIALFILFFKIPTKPVIISNKNFTQNFKAVLSNLSLVKLSIGILLLHAIMIINFTVLPNIFLNNLNLSRSSQGNFYLISFISSIFLFVPAMIVAERKNKLNLFFSFAIILLFLAEILFSFANNNYQFLLGLIIFFTAFNFLEAQIPSLVSKMSDPSIKGAALGFQSSCQFLGPAFGGIMYGVLHQHSQSDKVVFIFAAILAIVWLILNNMGENYGSRS